MTAGFAFMNMMRTVGKGETGMEDHSTGLIVKATGGFYYVQMDDAMDVLECRARGLFRQQGQSPLVGDMVGVEMTGKTTGSIKEIYPRKNSMIRPPIANLDRLFLVTSIREPFPNTLVLDKMIAIAEYKGIQPILVITKADLDDCSDLEAIYRKVGIPVYVVSSQSGLGVEQVRSAMDQPGISVFTGNSGVGKSSLLNALDQRLAIKTAEISMKLGRGRHTTTHVQLYPLLSGSYVADTPGFSSVELDRFDQIRKEELAGCFREFSSYLGQCRFADCSHTKEQGCAVLQAVQEGKIPLSRHKSYTAMYDELKQIKEWERK